MHVKINMINDLSPIKWRAPHAGAARAHCADLKQKRIFSPHDVRRNIRCTLSETASQTPGTILAQHEAQ
jgi:hypothetical protein